MIMERLVESQLPYGSVIKSYQLDSIADRCFVLPRDVSDSTRTLLRHMAASALIKLSTIKNAARLEVTPLLLTGHENHLRRLVLEVQSTYWGFADHGVLGPHIMAAWGKRFPRLQICVFLIHFVNIDHWRPMESIDRSVMAVDNSLQAKRGLENKRERIGMENIMVESIATFIRCGAGLRKLLRFSSRYQDSDTGRFGPLVEVTGEEPTTTNARRIFHQAYRDPRERSFWA
jgi:hypothetical protein